MPLSPYVERYIYLILSILIMTFLFALLYRGAPLMYHFVTEADARPYTINSCTRLDYRTGIYEPCVNSFYPIKEGQSI